MNRPIDPALLHSSEAFSHYLKNTAFRVDERAEASAHTQGQRVGISRPHESAHLHVAGEAAYIDARTGPDWQSEALGSLRASGIQLTTDLELVSRSSTGRVEHQYARKSTGKL
jgi:hypothetical protein